MFQFIHLADVHLASPLTHVSYDALRADQVGQMVWESFEKTISEPAKVFFIAGDLIEARSCDALDNDRLVGLFNKRPDAEFYWALGNHDAWDLTACLRARLPKHVVVFNPGKMDFIDSPAYPLRVFGMSYGSFNRYGSLLDKPDLAQDRMNVLVLHANVDRGRSDHLDLSSWDLEALRFDYVALGHIHTPVKLSKKVAYPGVLEPRDFGEPGPHGFIRGSWDGSLQTVFEPRARMRFYEEKLSLTGSRIKESIQEALLPYGQWDFVRLQLEGACDPQALRLALKQSDLGAKGPYVEIRDQTRPDYDLDSLRLKYDKDLIGDFIRSMDAYRDDRAYHQALEMGINLILEAME